MLRAYKLATEGHGARFPREPRCNGGGSLDNAEKFAMPSERRQPVSHRGFPAVSLGINPDGHLPPKTVIRLSRTPLNFPRRMEGGALASRICIFSAGHDLR